MQVKVIFQVCEKTKKKEKKTKKKTRKFAHPYLRKTLRDFLQIWCVVSLGRWAPPQQLWFSLDKMSWSYECVKLATLLFLLIYSRSLHAPHFLGPHDTLLCVLIPHPNNSTKIRLPVTTLSTKLRTTLI